MGTLGLHVGVILFNLFVQWLLVLGAGTTGKLREANKGISSGDWLTYWFFILLQDAVVDLVLVMWVYLMSSVKDESGKCRGFKRGSLKLLSYRGFVKADRDAQEE